MQAMGVGVPGLPAIKGGKSAIGAMPDAEPAAETRARSASRSRGRRSRSRDRKKRSRSRGRDRRRSPSYEAEEAARKAAQPEQKQPSNAPRGAFPEDTPSAASGPAPGMEMHGGGHLFPPGMAMGGIQGMGGMGMGDGWMGGDSMMGQQSLSGMLSGNQQGGMR